MCSQGTNLRSRPLVWITLSISSRPVYHRVDYCRGRGRPSCWGVCLSGEGAGWNKRPGSEATLGQAGGLIWKDSCNYESPEVTGLRAESDVWTRRRQTGRCGAPALRGHARQGSGVNIFNLLGSMRHLRTKGRLRALGEKTRRVQVSPSVGGASFSAWWHPNPLIVKVCLQERLVSTCVWILWAHCLSIHLLYLLKI